jgi:hypothetical protein
MKLNRTALGAALLASAFAGGAYAGNYGNTTDAAPPQRSNPVSSEQQQAQHPSSTTTAPSGESSTQPSGTAPSNTANERDFQALDTNHDGVISADERRQVKPGMRGGATGTSNSSGTGAAGTQPYQGPGSTADKAPENTGNPTPGSLSRPPAER